MRKCRGGFHPDGCKNVGRGGSHQNRYENLGEVGSPIMRCENVRGGVTKKARKAKKSKGGGEE